MLLKSIVIDKKIKILLKIFLNFDIIYLYFSEIGVKAMYVNDLIIFLRDENTRAIAARMLQDKKMDVEKASDFDVYNVLCEKNYLLCYHPMQEKILNLLSKACSCEIRPTALYDLNYRKKLWQKIFFDADIALPQIEFESVKTIELIKKSMLKSEKNNVLNLNSELEVSFQNIFSLLDSLLKKAMEQGIDTIFLDAENLVYIRPDNFHAQKAFETLKNGGDSSSIVLLWLLCRIFMDGKYKLVLRVNNPKMADDIIKLLSRLGLLPKIIIELEACNILDYVGFYNILIAHGEKNISVSLKLADSKKTENENLILEALKFIPLVFIENIENIDADFLIDLNFTDAEE